MGMQKKWAEIIEPEIASPYFCEIRTQICKDMAAGNIICPKPINIFRAFNLSDVDDIKVVILGQDPYYAQINQANGLAFAVEEDIKVPSSLNNIFKEVVSDLKCEMPSDRTLVSWASQGVFLLNTALTTICGTAFAHGKLWQPFTDKIIKILSDRDQPIVFMLWGQKAIAKAEMINKQKHFILEAPHPSGLSAYRGFFGCKHFSQANEILKKINKIPVKWASK